ncbi:MAG: GIY-YIG nuclease family protein, partial [Bacteroidota bacterium]
MFSVYILQSEQTGQYYFGQTNNLEARLERHQKNYVTSTKNKGPWTLVWTTVVQSRSEAMRLEKKLKG